MEKDKDKSKKRLCKINIHNFGKWQEQVSISLEEIGPDGVEELFHGLKTIEVKYIKWIRKCENCGYVQITNQRPNETHVTETKKVKTLQRKFNKINSDK